MAVTNQSSYYCVLWCSLFENTENTKNYDAMVNKKIRFYGSYNVIQQSQRLIYHCDPIKYIIIIVYLNRNSCIISSYGRIMHYQSQQQCNGQKIGILLFRQHLTQQVQTSMTNYIENTRGDTIVLCLIMLQLYILFIIQKEKIEKKQAWWMDMNQIYYHPDTRLLDVMKKYKMIIDFKYNICKYAFIYGQCF